MLMNVSVKPPTMQDSVTHLNISDVEYRDQEDEKNCNSLDR
jgi:hypothetical protein